MGEYAEYALQNCMRGGFSFSQDRKPPRRRILVVCPMCDKEYRGISGVMEHQNAKHGTKFTRKEIEAVPVEYEKEN